MVYDSIQALAEDKATDVVIFSGSDRSKLEETFGELNVWLAAENGMYLSSPQETSDEDVSDLCLKSQQSLAQCSAADFSTSQGILLSEQNF